MLARTFGCSVGSLPFTYPGLPLGLTKPKIVDFLPLVSRCEKRLIATSNFVSQDGRLQMTNIFLCTFKLEDTGIQQIDKFCKHCRWRGSVINAKTPPKGVWEMVCLPKAEGSLGVLNLSTHNNALLLKNLHKFYNREETPWVHLVWEKYYANGKLPNHVRKGSFWWRNNIKVLNSYKGLASVTVFKGDTCFFWLDGWSGQVPPLFLCKEQVHHCPECQTGYRLNHPAAPSNLG